MREVSFLFYDEIHLKLPPNQFGSLLREIAEQRICSAAQDVGYYESFLSDKLICAPFKVIYSNFNAISSSSILQPGKLVNAASLRLISNIIFFLSYLPIHLNWFSPSLLYFNT